MKKGYLALIFLGIIVVIFTLVITVFDMKNEYSNNDDSIENRFEVCKILLYSDVSTVSNQTTYQNPEWNLNVYQFTDIAIYIDRIDEFENSNYISSVYIDNIEIETSSLGTQKLYYLNPLEFGDCEITDDIEENEVTDSLKYSILNDKNEDDDVKYSIPIFFEDCSNPITLRYINHDILENYAVSSDTALSFKGNLLKDAGIELEDITSKISFVLNVKTEEGEIHKINVSFDIPLESEDSNIYEGSIEVTYEDVEMF